MGWDESEHPRDGRGRFRDKDAIGGWVEAVSDSMVRGHVPVRGRDLHEQFAGERPPGIGFGQPDPLLGRILAAQGFDGPPEVVTREEMDRRIAAGWPEMWRGVGDVDIHRSDETGSRTIRVSAAENAEQFRTGPLYPGSGVFGNGTYASVNPETALGYSAGTPLGADYHTTPGLLRIALRPDARVIDFDELLEMHPHLAVGYRDEDKGALDDVGRFAAALGYDAIAAQPRNANYRDGRIMYYVILNRTAVIVQEAQDG